jgi:thiol-disulfide isomerase/thioredoxin
MDPKLLPEPPAIVFEPGDRVAYFSGAELSKALAVDKQESDAQKQAPAATKKSVAIGAVAPLAPLETLDGKPFDLASLKGKVIVLDLWATWCGPCIRGLPVLQSFADEMKGNSGVAVYAVNSIEQPLPPGMKDPPETYRTGLQTKVSAFWEKSKFTMPTLIDYTSSLFEQYGFEGIPATIIIGADGKLVSTHTGFSPNMLQTLRAEVAKALAAAPKDATTSN